MINFKSFARISAAAIALSTVAAVSVSAQSVTLRGASLFDEEHAYTKTCLLYTSPSPRD